MKYIIITHRDLLLDLWLFDELIFNLYILLAFDNVAGALWHDG